MTWLLTALLSIAFVEILLRLPLMPAVARLLTTVRQVRTVVASPRISDHWKEKTLIVYAGRLLRNSLLIFGLLYVTLVATALASCVLSQSLDNSILALLVTVEGAIFATLVSLGYVFARSRLSGSHLVPSQL